MRAGTKVKNPKIIDAIEDTIDQFALRSILRRGATSGKAPSSAAGGAAGGGGLGTGPGQNSPPGGVEGASPSALVDMVRLLTPHAFYGNGTTYSYPRAVIVRLVDCQNTE